MTVAVAVAMPDESSRLEQLKEVFNEVKDGNPIPVLSLVRKIKSYGILGNMHVGMHNINPKFFTDSVDNTCEYFMGQFLMTIETNSWWAMNSILNAVSSYLEQLKGGLHESIN